MKPSVLVTGASSGIGKDIAKRLLENDFLVFVAARRVEKMRDLEALGAHVISMDITKDDEIVNAVKIIHEKVDGLDILINNAGYGSYGAMEDTSIEDVRYQFEVNLFGLGRLTQLVLPGMRSKRSGKIINISSMGGKVYTPLGCWYHATKHALEGWSDCLRLELHPFGIKVVVIEPGAIKTEFGDVMLGPMLDRSGNTAYGPLAQKMAKLTKSSYENGEMSPPSVISDIVMKAVNDKNPDTRYVAGKYAKPAMFVRKWLGDKAFDKIIKVGFMRDISISK